MKIDCFMAIMALSRSKVMIRMPFLFILLPIIHHWEPDGGKTCVILDGTVSTVALCARCHGFDPRT